MRRTRPDDEFGDELDPPMDRAALLLLAATTLASGLAGWALYRACVALLTT